jgi:UDP-N-acetylmuramate dehydrogenase
MNHPQNAPFTAKWLPNLSLQGRNTFGLASQAEMAYEITTAEQIPAILQEITAKKLPWRILGGGSNVILPETLLGATLLMNISGQEILSVDKDATYIAVGGGVNWHEFVAWTLEKNLPGLENLALIPGTVGAAPIQNIGAYGVEIAHYIDHIEAFDTQTLQFVKLSHSDCQFAYRDSLFKRQPGRYIVTQVTFRIPQAWQVNIAYADLANAFATRTTSPSPEDIFLAVCKIRLAKLPNPQKIGNAGSFFQNPIISSQQYETLLKEFPQLISYPDAKGNRKLAAGWLIDQCGFKGQRMGNVGVYEKQALVLVNHGGATAKHILNLAKSIQDAVRQKFGVALLIEPNIL